MKQIYKIYHKQHPIAWLQLKAIFSSYVVNLSNLLKLYYNNSSISKINKWEIRCVVLALQTKRRTLTTFTRRTATTGECSMAV